MLQYRPTAGTVPSRAFYNPGRDLANCGVLLAKQAMQCLDQRLEKDADLKKYMQQHNIKEEDINEAVRKLAESYNLIINKQPYPALKEAGFLEVPFPIRMLLFAMMGEQLFVATFSAVKDVSRPESEPPLEAREFLELVQTWGQEGKDSHP